MTKKLDESRDKLVHEIVRMTGHPEGAADVVKLIQDYSEAVVWDLVEHLRSEGRLR